MKKISLSAQLYSLVALSLLLSGALIAYAMTQLAATQDTLKYTIDNRMVSVAKIRAVRESFLIAADSARDVERGLLEPAAAAQGIESALEKAKSGWDEYFLAEMIPEEQELADQTTPELDAAYLAVDKLVTRLNKGDVREIEFWSELEVEPKLRTVSQRLKQLIDLQLVAANRDEENAKARYLAARRNSLLLLGGATLLAGVLAWLIIRGAMRKLGADPSDARDIAGRIADGDYLFEVPERSGDEGSLLGALRRMKDSLLHAKLDAQGQIDAISRAQAVIEFTPDGEILTANENFLKTMGYSLDEITGKHHSLFVTPADRESAAYREFWPALARGEGRQGQQQRIRKDGSAVWLSTRYTPILGLDGKPFKIVKHCYDVTDRRAEQVMNAAYKGALSNLAANVMVADSEGRIVLVNGAVVAMLSEAEADIRRKVAGFSASALHGRQLSGLFPGRDLQRELAGLVSGRQELVLTVGGRTMKLVANPMIDEGGQRLGTVIEWFERTQEIKTEAELQQIITAVTAGDLAGRISLAGKTGFFETLSKGINELVDSVATVVDEVQGLVSAANDGDLTKRVQLEGRAGLLVAIGSGINQLTDNMAGLVSRVKSAAGEVSRGADEISQGNTNLSQRTEEQASSLEETASSMEQMTSTVKQNADNAGQANQLAVAARDQAEKGGAVVSRAVKAMTEINESSKRIADIIGVIDEIAFQTNLLALNAAVEAARAGEQGRGFAVVASEVRNLAGRSATAAKEIKALIQDSVKKVDEGSSLVTQSGATLEQIVSAVKKVTDIVAEIAAASHEQSSGIEQVNKAVMQLDELTQQNAALVEEASAASQAMAEQARGLNDALSRYSVDERASRQATEAAVTASTSTGLASRKPVTRKMPPSKAASAVERRGESRRWQGSERSATNPSPVARATGTDDAVWQEF